MAKRSKAGPLYIVEHLEEGLGEWCRLEYKHMASFVPPEQLVFVRWPAEEDVTQLVSSGAAPKANTKRLEQLVPPADWPGAQFVHS
ncbi:unnamed protein product [Durusdinium trenchii]|uniref:Uncharacterized protein n=1 Tax=Durusdinium trenchii TaxID=1381693 RepID=A0ABP0S3J9_9DINO